MKRIVRILLITLVVLSSCSNTTSHLEFKGIPIDGDVISFSKKLEKKGFVHFPEHTHPVFEV